MKNLMLALATAAVLFVGGCASSDCCHTHKCVCDGDACSKLCTCHGACKTCKNCSCKH